MIAGVLRIRGRWFRVLTPRFAHQPLSGGGASVKGGRFNAPGQQALYLSADPHTAYAEYTQNVFDRPGLMCSYDVAAGPIADLTDPATLAALGVTAYDLAGRWVRVTDPPGQRIAGRLFAGGYAGATYWSAQHPAGTNIVLWRWSDDEARATVVDRLGEAPAKPIDG
jgi:RES domain-containing protein